MNWCVGVLHRWVASLYQHPDYMLIQACEKCGAIRRKDWPEKTQLGGLSERKEGE